MLVNVAKLKNDFVTIWSLDVIGHLWLIRYFGSNHIWHLWDSWFSSSPSFWVSLRNYDFILKVVKWLSLAGGWLVDVWGAVHSHVKINVCRKHHLKASWWMQIWIPHVITSYQPNVWNDFSRSSCETYCKPSKIFLLEDFLWKGRKYNIDFLAQEIP